MYLPSIVVVGYYFDKKRALATGVCVCGAGIGTFVFAPLGTFLVDNYSWKGANVIIGAIILNGIVFGLTYRPLKVARSTQPCVPPGVGRSSKGGNVSSSGWQVTLCDPVRHVSFRSGEACYELVYVLTLLTLLYFTEIEV